MSTSSFEELLRTARQALADGWLDEARVLFEKAFVQRPEAPDAHDGLASTLFLLDDAEGAALHFTEATRLDPRRASAHINLGAALSRLGQHARALEAIRHGIELDPQRAEGHYNLGLIQRAGGDVHQAQLSLEHALQLDPKLLGAHFNLGTLFMTQGRTVAAHDCFRRALELDPSCDEAAEALAHAEIVLGGLRAPGSQVNGEQVHPGAPVKATPRTSLRAPAFSDVAPRGPSFGDTSLDRCEPVDSHWSLTAPKADSVTATAPDRAAPPVSFQELLERAAAALSEGSVEEAHDLYEKARLQSPGSGPAHYGLAAAKFMLNDAEGAAVHFAVVTRLEPQRAAAHVNLGAALSKLGDHRQAAAAIRQGIELAPGFAEAYCNLGLVCRAAGEDREARQAFEQAIALEPQLADGHFNLGNLFLSQRSAEAAIRCYRRVLDLEPSWDDAAEALAEAEAMLATASHMVCSSQGGRNGSGTAAPPKVTPSAPAAPLFPPAPPLDEVPDLEPEHSPFEPRIDGEACGPTLVQLNDAVRAAQDAGTLLMEPITQIGPCIRELRLVLIGRKPGVTAVDLSTPLANLTHVVQQFQLMHNELQAHVARALAAGARLPSH